MMSMLGRIAGGLRALVWARRMDRELDEELRGFLEAAVEAKMRAGMNYEQALRAARMEVGSPEAVRDEVRQAGWESLLDTFWRDLRYGARALRQSPGFTIVAMLTLAVGIGLNTTLFTAFDAVALRPLPVKDASSLMRLERWFKSQALGDNQYAFSYQEYLHLRAHNHSFADLIAASFPIGLRAVLPAEAGSGAVREPEVVVGQLVSANYFSHLGVSPFLGRGFRPDENQAPGANPTVVVSYPFWRHRLNADPDIVGKFIRVNDTSFAVIGVTPDGFIGTANPPRVPDFWAPLTMQPQLVLGQDWIDTPTERQVQVMGHLARGARAPSAQAELVLLVQQFEALHPQPEDATLDVTLQLATLFGNTEDLSFKLLVGLLMVIVGVVLLTACANLANMLLARASGRQREIGLRLALGASRARVMRQLLTESGLLALLSGFASLLLSAWATQLVWVAAAPFMRMSPAFVLPASPDIRILAYMLVISTATGVFFGLVPALQLSRPDVTTALKDSGSAFGQHVKRSRLRSLLVGGQVAVSMVFLVIAGLLTRGLLRAQAAEPGFETRTVYPMGLSFSSDPATANARARDAFNRVQTLLGSQSTGLAEKVPMWGTWTVPFEPLKTTAPPGKLPRVTLASHVSAGYFSALGVPIVRGRNFAGDEDRAGRLVAIVSEATAHALWPAEDPIGQRLEMVITRGGTWTEFTVIGVARDVRTANLSRVDPSYVYLATDAAQLQRYDLLFRIQGDASSALAAVGNTLQAVDPGFSSNFSPASLEDGPLREQRLMARAMMLSASGLASVALLLAAIGIYGVMAYLVSQREREVGIRIALGASGRDVVSLLVGQGMRPVVVGSAIGLLGAALVSALLKATLVFPGSVDVFFGVGAFNPVTFMGLAGFLAVISLLACFIPARRVAKIDPMVVLRYE